MLHFQTRNESYTTKWGLRRVGEDLDTEQWATQPAVTPWNFQFQHMDRENN
jgi:hypothetical protein